MARDDMVGTSGIYERWFESGGRRWHNIMDTTTGWPLEGILVAATVVVEGRAGADGPPLVLLALRVEQGTLSQTDLASSRCSSTRRGISGFRPGTKTFHPH
ncbi:MAG: FAD:protein FMN transferase [Spirochaetes bacterium]|nr:FAD:protein FMN transferase [Spirochaetota bacterium]